MSLLDPGELQLVDRYQLIGEIASGGMATVYLARLAGVGGFQRLVAIKRLHPHLAKEIEFVEMFLDEARLAASIHHQNVVPILEIGTNQDGYYLVMEYIEGVTLARLITQATLKREPIERPLLLRIVLDTLAGLHAAHEKVGDDGEPLGVVHRDCSPQNILVGLDGCSRITDFGVARASSRLATTREGAMKGKLAYMAPEQTQGEDIDRRADIFSVAVVLWEILTARRLFKAASEAQTLKRLLHDPIVRMSKLVPDMPPALDEVVARALSRDPADRYQTAAAFADALEEAARQWGEAEGVTEPVASARAVAALMQERYGEDATRQRESVREWVQQSSSRRPEARPTNRGWPARPSAPSSEVEPASGPAEALGDEPAGAVEHDDATTVYEPTNVGVTRPRVSVEAPITARSPVARRPGVGLWLGGVALVVVVPALFLLGRSSGTGAANPTPSALGQASSAPSLAPASGSAPTSVPAVSSSAPSNMASSEPSGMPSSRPTAEPARPTTESASSASPRVAWPVRTATPATAAPTSPSAAPTARPKPAEDDDLSNPYR